MEVPSLEAYICLIKSFVNANGYYIEFSKSSAVTEQAEGREENRKHEQEPQQQIEYNKGDLDYKSSKEINDCEVMIIQFNISYKFSQFLGDVYRILLEEFCTINRFELTERLVFYEYKRK